MCNIKGEIFGAFIKDNMDIEPVASGPLDNLIFAVKDVFAIKGHTNSAGNPVWLNTHQAADQDAVVIRKLLESGATLRGVTVTDELMYSLKGDNKHYPPTINPRFPDGYSGGSSSGSAVAVAAELADFAIGTDTGGSVRIPSAYCGLFGIRPTHGAVAIDGVIPLAPSYDTVGWMARDAATLEKVGDCLLPQQPVKFYSNFYALEEAWQLVASEEEKEALLRFATQLIKEKHIEKRSLPFVKTAELAETFRIIQGIEAWENHGQWVEAHQPDFGADIAGRFAAASKMKHDAVFHAACEEKQRFGRQLDEFLGNSALLILPTTYGPAPARNGSLEQAERVRAQTMQLTCIAGVSGLPQVTIPLMVGGKPLGLSLISGRGTDRQLLDFVEKCFQK